MHRIDGADAVTPIPAAAVPGANPDYFFRKATAGVRGTVVTTDWANAVQEEIANAIELAGIALVKGTRTQLDAAIVARIAAATGVAGMESDIASESSFQTHARVLIGCFDSSNGTPTASGAAASAISCDGDVVASGAATAIIASRDGTAAGIQSAIIACDVTGTTTGASTQNTIVAAASGANVITGSGAAAAIIATTGANEIGTNGTAAAVIASFGVKVGTGAASSQAGAFAARNARVDGDRSAIIACEGIALDGSDVDNEGTVSVIIAGRGTAADPTRIETAVGQGAIIGASDCEIDAGNRVLIAASQDTDVTSSGANNAAIACLDGLISGTAATCALIACAPSGTEEPTISAGTVQAIIAGLGDLDMSGNRSAIIACLAGLAQAQVVSGDQSVAIGCEGAYTLQGDSFLLVGSTFDSSGPTVTKNDGIGGGSAAALNWDINSATGEATFKLLDLNNEVAISGAGGPPTLAANVTGGTGPQTNAQNGWLEFKVGGTTTWMPTWV